MLTKNEMKKIRGGNINWTRLSIVGSVITVLAGIFDGFFRPMRCN